MAVHQVCWNLRTSGRCIAYREHYNSGYCKQLRLKTGKSSFQEGKRLFKMKNGGRSILLVNGNFYSFRFIVAATIVVVTRFFHATQAAMPAILLKKSGISKPSHAVMHVHGSPGRSSKV